MIDLQKIAPESTYSLCTEEIMQTQAAKNLFQQAQIDSEDLNLRLEFYEDFADANS